MYVGQSEENVREGEYGFVGLPREDHPKFASKNVSSCFHCGKLGPFIHFVH